MRQFLESVPLIGPVQAVKMASYINDSNKDGYFRLGEIEEGIEAYLLRPDSSLPRSQVKGVLGSYVEEINKVQRIGRLRIPATYGVKLP